MTLNIYHCVMQQTTWHDDITQINIYSFKYITLPRDRASQKEQIYKLTLQGRHTVTMAYV